MTRIPKGCDQQGRYPDAMEDEPPRQNVFDVVMTDLAFAVAVMVVIAAIVILIMRLAGL